jgi:hypothetical protein
LVQTGLDDKGKIKLRHGANGPEFENPVVVGSQYIVKLDQRPEDKLTVRQTGPYAASTKQPVKGKKQGGGQRIGEMESWALQVHQVPHLLEEFLTTKADDVIRRLEVQKLLDTALDRLDANVPPAHLPESLRVALTLLQASGIVAFPAQGEGQSIPLPFPFPLRSDKLGPLPWRFIDETDLQVWDRQSTLTAVGQQLAGAGRSPSRSAEVQNPSTFERVAYVQLQCGCEGFDDEVVIRQGRKWFCQQHQKDYFTHLQRRTHRWRPVRGGLYDAEIFGANPYLIGDQETKGDRETQEKAWRERFGYIRLACAVENPLTKQPLTFLLILPAAFRFRPDPDDPARNRLDRPGKKSLDWHYARIVRINTALQNPAQTGLYAEKDLQEAIWHLFRGYEGDKAGECLERLIKGKHGIFRQAVLGKRTDYSGRAVIVPDPELALDECRLPYRIGVQLF